MKQLSVEERYVSLKDGRVFFTRAGRGYPLLMLHSARQSSFAWQKVFLPMAQHFECYNIDMPGYGRSDTPPYQYSIERFAEAILELMDKLGIGRASFLGHRTGAMISTDVASERPEAVNKLVLVSCASWNKEEAQEARKRWMQGNWDERGGVRAHSLEDAVKRYGRVDKEWVDRSAEIAQKNGPWIRLIEQSNTSYDMTLKVGRIRAPTLIIYGEKDEVVQNKERLRNRIPGSILRILPDCATPHYEVPELFLKEVVPFLIS